MSYQVRGCGRVLNRLLGKEEMSKRLDDLLKKREQLNAQIQKERNKQAKQRRKDDTRRKILMGALLSDLIKNGEFSHNEFIAKLDKFLTRDTDRKLFYLDSVQNQSNTTATRLKKSSTVEVILEEFNEQKRITLINEIGKITKLTVDQASKLLKTLPTPVIKVDSKEAEQIQKRLNEAGAKVTLKN